MANEVIGIDVQVSLEQLRAQLATLGPGMDKEAKAMTAALAKEIKKQTAAIKKQAADMAATNGVKKLGEQAENAGVKFDKLGMAMGPISGVISKISPEAGSLASVVAGLTSGFQGLAAAGGGSMASLAPFAAILAPIALGIGVVAGVMADMEREAEESATAMDGLVSAMQAVDDMTAGAADALTAFKVKTGQMTSTEAAYQKAIKQVATEYTLANAEIEESIRLRIASGKEEGMLDDVAALREEATALKEQTEARSRSLAALKEWDEEERKSAEFIAERDKAAKKAAADTAAAAKAAAAAEQVANEAEEAATEKRLADMKRLDDHRVEYATKAIARKNHMAELDAHAEAYVEKLVEERLSVQVQAAEEAQRAMENISASARDTIGEVLGSLNTFASLAADAAGEAADRSMERLERIRGLLADLTTESVDASTLTGDALVRAYKRGEVGAEELTEAQRKSIATVLSEQEDAAAARTRADRKAARAAWQTQQDLNIAQTFAAGAVALIQAFAQLGPVAGAIAGIGIAAATAASIATISSQKPAFHSGGVVGGSANGQGEVSARLLPGEALLNRQATNALGPSGVAALNSGASMGAVSLRIGRLEAREIVRTDVAAGGLIVRTAKSAAASAGNTAGRTGRRPIA
jgi:hypothetical protein